MRSDSLDKFFRLLSAGPAGTVFNPWKDRDPTTDLHADAVAQRVRRLERHLSVRAEFLLLGEAAGYQGCKVSGIPFTSERLLLEGGIPRITTPAGRLSSRPRPWSEPSATTVWKTLRALGIAERTVLWNAYPWHPHKPGALHSNRPPTRSERVAGIPVLEALLAAFPRASIFAVGRNAEASLGELGLIATPLRHPSMGGARQFSEQLARGIHDGD